jgi:hypothetical protein
MLLVSGDAFDEDTDEVSDYHHIEDVEDNGQTSDDSPNFDHNKVINQLSSVSLYLCERLIVPMLLRKSTLTLGGRCIEFTTSFADFSDSIDLKRFFSSVMFISIPLKYGDSTFSTGCFLTVAAITSSCINSPLGVFIKVSEFWDLLSSKYCKSTETLVSHASLNL